MGGYFHMDVFDKEKFADLIIQECIRACRPELRDMISRGRVSVMIKEHFGMPKDTSTIDAYVAKMIADRWDDIPETDYARILTKVKDLEPIDDGAGTHCYNSVYQIGDWKYDLTYEHQSGKLIDIKKKAV
jgi:hypothetical protein